MAHYNIVLLTYLINDSPIEPGVDVEGVGRSGVFVVVYECSYDDGEYLDVSQPHLYTQLCCQRVQCSVSSGLCASVRTKSQILGLLRPTCRKLT